MTLHDRPVAPDSLLVRDSISVFASTTPTYLGVASGQGGTTTTNVDVSTIVSGSPPSAGHLLIAHVAKQFSATNEEQHLNAPAGWHRLGSAQNGSSGVTSAIFWKIREAGDSNTVTFTRTTSGTSNHNICTIHCIRGADQTRPICRHSIQRASGDTYSWLAETTPVADCLALAIGSCPVNRNGLSPASGWTERVDLAQSTALAVYIQSKEAFAQGASTGDPSAVLSGSGSTTLVQHMLAIQPPQPVAPKDVRVTTGSLTSPTSTGNQDIAVGFDVKALIIYGMRQNADATTPNIEFAHGIGADDGVHAAAQRCVGLWHLTGFTNGLASWNRDAIIGLYFTTSVATPDLLATYSRITGGFRLNWTEVEASGYDFNYIAFGGADFEAVVGVKDGAASPLTGLPWRPDMAHVISTSDTGTANQIRANVSGASQMTMGWLDPNAGAEWNLTQNLNQSYVLRDNAFCSDIFGAALAYELQFSQATADGWSWFGSATNGDSFFYLALYWGNATYFPAQVEMVRADASASAGADQVMASFGKGQTFATKKLAHSISGRANTSVSAASGGVGEGHARFAYAVVDQGAFAYAKGTGAGPSSERRRKLTSSFLVPLSSDLDAPAKIGAWQSDLATVDWATNDSTPTLIGLFTLGFIGQLYERELFDDVEVTDELGQKRTTSEAVVVSDAVARTVTFGRRPSTDAIVVADSLMRTASYGRKPSDTIVVAEVFARTPTYGRKPVDSVVVTDSVAFALTKSRKASDNAVVADVLAFALTKSRKASDTVVVTDALARTTTFGRKPSDAVAITDALATMASIYGRVLVDAAVVAESLSLKVAFGRHIVEAVSVVDQISVEVSLVNTDTVATADLTAIALHFERAYVDTVAASDRLAPTTARQISDSITSADQLTRATDTRRTISDALTTTEALQEATAGYVRRIVEDSTNVDDALFRVVSTVRATDDALVVADVMALSVTQSLVVVDTVGALDAVAVAQEFGATLTDAVSALDALAIAKDLARELNEAIGLTDSVGLATGKSIGLDDVVAAVDVFRVGVSALRAFADLEVVTDSISAILAGLSLAFTTTDSIAVTDATGRIVDYARSAVDALATSESLTLEQIGIEVESQDAVVATDSVRMAIATAKSLSDVLALSEGLVAQRIFGGGGSDAVAASDAVFANLFTLSADRVATTDSLVRTVWSTRSLHDAPGAEDSVHVGEISFVMGGIGDGANNGLIIMSTIGDSDGPLIISGGPGVSTGPVGFVASFGDFVTTTDRVELGVILTVNVGDSVEATG